MRLLTALLIVSLLLGATAPAYAAGNIFSAIPDDYYIHFFAGAALQGFLQKHDVTPMNSFFITLGLALAKEAVDSAVLGGQFNWAEAGISLLGASFVYYF